MSLPTSQTHPLQIGGVRIRGGTIGLTFCPGKKQKTSATGGWWRDLDADLGQVEDWGAAALVTLMEDFELDELQVAALGAETRRRGMQWFHLPIVDGDIPDARFESQWVEDGEKLRSLLADGGRVLIHCKGGLGRTGTVAARLLIELGQDAETAIAQVRAARRGAIADAGQEDYVRRCRPL